MAAAGTPRKRRPGLAIAAWSTVIIGAYAVLAVASLWGIVAGAVGGGLGALLAGAVLTDDPPRRTRRVAKVGLTLNALALVVCATVLLAIGISEL